MLTLGLRSLLFLTQIYCVPWLYLCIKVFLSAQATGIPCIPLEHKHAYSMKDFLIQQNTTSSLKEKL